MERNTGAAQCWTHTKRQSVEWVTIPHSSMSSHPMCFFACWLWLPAAHCCDTNTHSHHNSLHKVKSRKESRTQLITHSRRNSNWMWMVFEQVSWWSTTSYCYSSWVWVKSRGICNQYRLYTYTDFRDLPIAVTHSEWDSSSFQAIHQLPNQKSEWFWQLLGTQTRIKFPLFTLNTTAPSMYINILLY